MSLTIESELHDAGIACMDVLFEQVHTEIVHGNLRNIPNSILRLFVLSLIPRLAFIRRNGDILSPALIGSYDRAVRELSKDAQNNNVIEHIDAMKRAFDLDVSVH